MWNEPSLYQCDWITILSQLQPVTIIFFDMSNEVFLGRFHVNSIFINFTHVGTRWWLLLYIKNWAHFTLKASTFTCWLFNLGSFHIENGKLIYKSGGETYLVLALVNWVADEQSAGGPHFLMNHVSASVSVEEAEVPAVMLGFNCSAVLLWQSKHVRMTDVPTFYYECKGCKNLTVAFVCCLCLC